MKRVFACCLCIFVPAWPQAGEPAAKPILVLDAGGHADSVPKIVFTLDGKGLISVSKDKTIRIWDLETGTCSRTLRPPVGLGRFGVLYMATLSPQGRLAVAGVGPREGESPIYLINLVTGQIERTLEGHTSMIRGLAFTPDGKFLISASEKDPGRIWNAATGECVHVLQLPGTNIRVVATSPDSRKVVTGSPDGAVRIWSIATGECEVTMKDAYKDRYYGFMSIAWSPDGKSIATGSFDWNVRIWNPDGTLRKNYGSMGDLAFGLAFSPDGQKLLVARGFDYRPACLVLDVDSGETKLTFARHLAWDCAYSPDGKLAATSGYMGDILVWNPEDGHLIQRLAGHSQAVWGAAWSADGKTIAWGNSGERGQQSQFHPLERTFHLLDLEWGGAPGGGFRRAREATDSWMLERGKLNQYLIVKTGEGAIANELKVANEPVSCFTLIGKDQVAMGTSYGLYLYHARGGTFLRQFAGHSGNLHAVAPSPDDRYLLSGSVDHTLRIWTVEQSEPLLSLFFARDEWIAWTPQGYYAASPGGERLMGWQVSNGPDKMATFHPAAQFRKSFYRPDVIKLLLQEGSVEKALAQADKARGKKSQITEVAGVLPPFVLITSPDKAKIDVTEPTVEVRFIAKPVGKHPITALRLMINGRPYPGAEGLKKFDVPRTDDIRDSWTVRLAPGVNSIAVQAESLVSKAVSEAVEVTVSKARGAEREPDEKEKKLELPNLYVLAIGVSEYPQEAMKLKYAAKDAQVLAKTFQATSHSLYRNIEVKVLTDKDATRTNVLKGLTWLRKQMTQRDVAIVFFAGHGSQDVDGKLYLLPVDVDREDLLSSAVAGEQIKSVIGGIPGKVIMLLDACHSGAVDGEKRRAAGSLTDDLVRDLVTDDYGVIVMCSSMGREFSLESATVEHGFFTLALIEGLSGKADYNKTGVVYLNGLDLYVTTRVKELSKGKQHPVTTRPTSIRSFPLSRPEKQSSSRAPALRFWQVLASKHSFAYGEKA